MRITNQRHAVEALHIEISGSVAGLYPGAVLGFEHPAQSQYSGDYLVALSFTSGAPNAMTNFCNYPAFGKNSFSLSAGSFACGKNTLANGVECFCSATL